MFDYRCTVDLDLSRSHNRSQYEFGDLTKEVGKRVQSRVEEFTGKPYEFGDVSRTIEERRQKWVKDYLGEEAAANYQFGDVTKKFVKEFTGKDDYQVRIIAFGASLSKHQNFV